MKALAPILRQHRGILLLALGVASSTMYLACGGGEDREFGNAGGAAGTAAGSSGRGGAAAAAPVAAVALAAAARAGAAA